MNIVLAIDSFKGCLTSQQVEAALAACYQAHGLGVTCLPMSDGGDGMLHAFATALSGTVRETTVHDPLMRTIKAHYAVCPDRTAIVESAQACGLSLLSPEERNPLLTSTYGVGELLLAAMSEGSRHFIIGLGGSGTSDCGRGMLQALAQQLTCGSLEALPHHPLIKSRHFTLASDVQNPLYGPNGAAWVYGAQKGATPDMQHKLDLQAQHFAEQSAQALGHDASLCPGAGAAGGLGYAFMQYLGAEVHSGADMLLERPQTKHLLSNADLVITGEGSADRQTLMGKLPQRVLHQVKQNGHAPVWLIAGRVADQLALMREGFDRVACVTPPGMPLATAIRPEVARANLVRWAESSIDM